jgi:hypothetical protein
VSYLDWLRNDSELHKVTHARGGGGFRIAPATNSIECRKQFDDIVQTAISRSISEGYSIDAHRDSTRGGYEYLFADIILDE